MANMVVPYIGLASAARTFVCAAEQTFERVLTREATEHGTIALG